MFPTIPVNFSCILYGKATARTLFLEEKLPALSVRPAGCKAFLFTPNLKRKVHSSSTSDLPWHGLEMPSLFCPSISPQRIVESSLVCCCAAKCLFCPPFLIVDSVVAQKQRQLTTTIFSRGSELILTQSVGIKEINFFWMRLDKKLMWMLIS